MTANSRISVDNLRLGFVLTNLSDGGAQRVMLTLARVAANKKLLARFYVLDPTKVAFANEAIGLGVRGVLGNLGSKWLYVFCLPVLWARLMLSRANVIVSTLVLCNIISVLAVRLQPFRRPFIVVREATTLGARAKAGGLLARSLACAASWIYPLADLILAPSEGVAEDLRVNLGINGKKIRVLNNAAVPPGFEAMGKEDIHHHFFDEGGPVFIAMGRLAPVKGFDVLVEAWCSVSRELPQARLIILGEGDSRRSLEDQVERHNLSATVDLVGFKANPFPYLRRSCVFVLSSYWEGSPNSLIQAIACGVTPVSSDCPSGPREILKGGALGYLVPPGSADELATAMLRAYNGPVDPVALMARASDFGHEASFDSLTKMCVELQRRSGDG